MKHFIDWLLLAVKNQPPSGGCVLKLIELSGKGCNVATAAFGRLCVETVVILTDAMLSCTSRLRAAVC